MDEKLNQPPRPGLYISTKEALGMRIVVEDVTEPEADGFFIVSIIDEASAADPGAAGDELAPEEWFALVEQFGLQREDD